MPAVMPTPQRDDAIVLRVLAAVYAAIALLNLALLPMLQVWWPAVVAVPLLGIASVFWMVSRYSRHS